MRKFTLTIILLLWAVAALAAEQFKNLATTTTTGQTNVATTLVVASATLFPSSGTFTVYVDSGSNKELERVTAVSGTTFTVTRGLSPTSAVAHSSGVQVVMVQSAESFTQLESDAAAAAAQPGYINTPTVSAGAATLLAQCVVAGCTDYNRVANGTNTGSLTLTTPAAAGLHDAEALDIEVTTDGVHAPSSLIISGGSGVTLDYGNLGNTFNATTCGALTATGKAIVRWQWNGTTGNLTLRGCAPVPASTTLGVALGGTGLATLTAHDVYVGNGTSAPTAISPSTSGFVLTSNGTSADPSFQTASGSGTIYCTDNWTPGTTTLTGATTYTAGHTYCLNAPGTVTASGAQNINVANVTVACPSPGMIIQRTSTTSLFIVTAAGFRLIGCGIDGNTQTTGNTGPLVNLNAADDALIENNIFTNTGTTAGTGLSGTIWVQAGNRDRIINNTFSTSQTDVAVWINSQSGTKVVNDLTIQGNKIPTFAPASNLYAITLNQASGNSSTNVKILENTIVLTNTHAEGIASLTPAVVENTGILGMDVSGNTITATANVPRMMHLFGIDYGRVEGNILDDGGNIVSGAVMDLGDDYNTAHVGNQISARSGSEAGLNCIDCAEDTFVGNTIDGVGNSDPGLLIGSSAAATNNNVITGNAVRLQANGVGIEVQANGAAASFNTVVGNTVTGASSNATSVGVDIVDTSGGAVANTVESNLLAGLNGTSNTCISVGSGATNTYVGHNNLNSCKVSMADAGTSSTDDLWDGVVTITLASGTGTATVPIPGIAAVGVCQDTTTATNKCTIAFTSSTATATTVTATGTSTDHCTCTVQVH